MSKLQLLYKEDYKGWVSFLTYYPEFYATLGNKFFTVYQGQVYEHNDTNNPIRNNFYGISLTFKLTFIVNVPQNEDVIFKTVMLEGNDAWNMTINTNFTFGELSKSEFNRRESYYYAHFRKNENENDLHGLKTEGIGILISNDANKFYFDYIPDEINFGDKLYVNNGGNNIYIGSINEITKDYLSVEELVGPVITDEFYFAMKDSRIEGSDLRGYYAEITLSNDNQNSIELYAVNTNIIKSYV